MVWQGTAGTRGCVYLLCSWAVSMAPWHFTYEVQVQRQNYEEFQDGESSCGPFKYGVHGPAQVPCPSSWPVPRALLNFYPWVKILPKLIRVDLGSSGQMEISQAEQGRPVKDRRRYYGMGIVVKPPWPGCPVPWSKGTRGVWVGELGPGWKSLR